MSTTDTPPERSKSDKALHLLALATAMLWAAAMALLCVLVMVVLSTSTARAATAEPAQPAAAQPYRATLLRAAHSQWGLDAPVAMLAAQVHAESAWRPQAVSQVGAQGLGQFMPATATWWCAAQGTPAAACQPTNPTWALRSLVGYDKWLFDRLAVAGAQAPRLWATLRAYNGGLGHWQAEARLAANTTRAAVDAACGRARRHPLHCAENLAYPRRVLVVLQPRYGTWGRSVAVTPDVTAEIRL